MNKVIETPHTSCGIGYIPGNMLKYDRENNLLIGEREALPNCLRSKIYIQSPVSLSSKEFNYRCQYDISKNSWFGHGANSIPLDIMNIVMEMKSFPRKFVEVWKCHNENLYFIA